MATAAMRQHGWMAPLTAGERKELSWFELLVEEELDNLSKGMLARYRDLMVRYASAWANRAHGFPRTAA